MSDLLERIHREIRERLAASRAAVEESARLEAALEALAGAADERRGCRATAATPAPAGQAARRRAPRGANRSAVLAAVAERPGTSAGEIAASSGVTRGVVDAQLRQLVTEGLLVKRDLPSGRSGYSPAPSEDPPAEWDAHDRETAPATPQSPSTGPPSESSEAAAPEAVRASDLIDETVAATDETRPPRAARPSS